MQATLPLREVVRVTPRTVLLRLALEGVAFPFEAGQAVMAGVPGQAARKPYAIACAPTLASRLGLLELLVQIDVTSPEPHLEDLTAGARLDIEGPFGGLRLPAPAGKAPRLFVADGTGIAPLRALIWETLLAESPPPLTLLHSARSRDDLAFAEEFAALEEAGRLRYLVTTTRERHADGDGRRLDATRLREALPSPDARCYVCGPEAFVRDVTAALVTIGISADRIAGQ